MKKKGVITKLVPEARVGEDVQKGTVVFKYTKNTYGCISSGGIAVTLEEDKTPFFEVPKNSVDFKS